MSVNEYDTNTAITALQASVHHAKTQELFDSYYGRGAPFIVWGSAGKDPCTPPKTVSLEERKCATR